MEKDELYLVEVVIKGSNDGTIVLEVNEVCLGSNWKFNENEKEFVVNGHLVVPILKMRRDGKEFCGEKVVTYKPNSVEMERLKKEILKEMYKFIRTELNLDMEFYNNILSNLNLEEE